MTHADDLREPWMIAAWPGMGNVALGAASYLVDKLAARPAHEVLARDLFDVRHVEVKAGLLRVSRSPRSVFFEWRNPGKGRDLIIFLGQAQPSTGGYAFCHRVLDYATQREVSRLYTFAAMASQLHPSYRPRVFGVSTQADALHELRTIGVDILQEGQIGGLNGVFLAAGAERGIPGVCLMGELPFFAVGVPNPKASQAVLEAFTAMAEVELDFTEMTRQSAAVEKGLLELLEKMREAARHQAETEGEEDPFSVSEPAPEDENEPETAPSEPTLDYGTRRRIEKMFEEAREDRSRAFHLKEVLDRLGVFKQYEDRFLDLFKHAE